MTASRQLNGEQSRRFMIENSIKLVVELERPEVVGHPGVFFEPAMVKSSLKVFGVAQIASTSATATAPEHATSSSDSSAAAQLD